MPEGETVLSQQMLSIPESSVAFPSFNANSIGLLASRYITLIYRKRPLVNDERYLLVNLFRIKKGIDKSNWKLYRECVFEVLQTYSIVRYKDKKNYLNAAYLNQNGS